MKSLIYTITVIASIITIMNFFLIKDIYAFCVLFNKSAIVTLLIVFLFIFLGFFTSNKIAKMNPKWDQLANQPERTPGDWVISAILFAVSTVIYGAGLSVLFFFCGP